ncbi:hypothetical protein N2604_06880 [Bradyrhizobium sp. CB1015]|nr:MULTISPECIES: hypothetical protein [Bradyrhizobium]UWU95912.1 hypothetical protein N2604_06880 [Bradyrhizobium sp. CB1015]
MGGVYSNGSQWKQSVVQTIRDIERRVGILCPGRRAHCRF